MADETDAEPGALAALDALRARTPARLVVGRAGAAYRTATQLELREDHAAAVDAERDADTCRGQAEMLDRIRNIDRLQHEP